MEGQVTELVKIAQDTYTASKKHRVLIGIVGIPGSGKSTLAKKLVEGINSVHGTEIATTVPMDGYHLSRAQLDRLPDPSTAHFRRGAPFTFDPCSLLALIEALCPSNNPSPKETIYAPSFSHALKDPVPRDIPLHPHHRILVFEGNYLGLDMPVWRDISKSFDQLWLAEVPREIARQRLVARHLAARIVQSVEEGERRADENDLPNGDLIIQKTERVDRIIPYVEDFPWDRGV